MATIFHTRMLTEAYRKKASALRRSGRIFRSCLFILRLPAFRRSFLSSHKKKEELMNTRANIRPGVPLAGFLSSARQLTRIFKKRTEKRFYAALPPSSLQKGISAFREPCFSTPKQVHPARLPLPQSFAPSPAALLPQIKKRKDSSFLLFSVMISSAAPAEDSARR